MEKKDKLRLKDFKNKFEDNREEKPKEVEIKSKQYNNDFETELKRRENEETSDALMWGCVIGFALFFILLIIIIVCTK